VSEVRPEDADKVESLQREVTEYRHQMQALAHRLIEVEEIERHRAAYHVSHELGQTLTALKFALEVARRAPAESVREKLQEADRILDGLVVWARGLALDLRPPMLADLGLLPTLLWHLERYTADTGVEIDLQHQGIERRFPADLEVTALRFVQEALTNVAQHSGAQEALVRAWAGPEYLFLQVQDKGLGFNPKQIESNVGIAGLPGIRERVTLLGGQMTIEAQAGHGTCVAVALPISAAGEPVGV
jgi:signal transduction histidine kinase